ncbi:MAG: Zn-ribbon domain-containing OB-fold protein [Achromobacter kerstersii]|uniref:Zn-ribbon domain-containing OB-fold protein n=1 Tax=Achromobacter kerstersii TaxID=1353890 RepID=UPI003CFF82C7
MSLLIDQCRACAHRFYPSRLWCPACGHDQVQPVAADYAELLAWTVMPAKKDESKRDESGNNESGSNESGNNESGNNESKVGDPDNTLDLVVIATVRALPDGPVLVARLEDMPTHIGQRLRLFGRKTQGRVLPWAWTLPG